MNRSLVAVSHHPGRHCASTALCNMANFHGIPFTEAMCFGIGAGLGIWYLNTGTANPSRMVHVRSADIEAQFFRRIGCPFSWQQFPDPSEAVRALCGSADKGLPSLVQTDIYHLPYYGSSTHFPGHDITVWGYDAREQVFFITDTERTGLLTVPFDDMRKALYSGNGFFPMKGNQFSPESLPQRQDLGQIIRRAIVRNSRLILSGDLDFQGVMALEKWMKELTDVWPLLPDWQWASRFAYQVIERRGTGGGGFRFMYADFLKEASAYCPQIASYGLSDRMLEIAGAWSDLAYALKHASGLQQPGFSMVADKIRTVHALESEYHREACSLL